MNIGELNRKIRELGGLRIKLRMTHLVDGSHAEWVGIFTTAVSSHSETVDGMEEFSAVTPTHPGSACRFLKEGESDDVLIESDDILSVEPL